MSKDIVTLTTGETLTASKQRAALLREALLSLDDIELTIVVARLAGATARDARIFTGTIRHGTVLRIEKRAMAKMREWFAARGVFELSDIL